jgi:hypothetical protein
MRNQILVDVHRSMSLPLILLASRGAPAARQLAVRASVLPRGKKTNRYLAYQPVLPRTSAMNREQAVTRVLWPVRRWSRFARVLVTGFGPLFMWPIIAPSNERTGPGMAAFMAFMHANERWPVHHGEVPCVNGCSNHDWSFSDCNSYTKLCLSESDTSHSYFHLIWSCVRSKSEKSCTFNHEQCKLLL